MYALTSRRAPHSTRDDLILLGYTPNMARPPTKLTPSAPSFTIQAVLPADLGPRIQALRIEGPHIYSASAVIREAIRRGLVQLELERSLGRSVMADPLPLTE